MNILNLQNGSVNQQYFRLQNKSVDSFAEYLCTVFGLFTFEILMYELIKEESSSAWKLFRLSLFSSFFPLYFSSVIAIIRSDVRRRRPRCNIFKNGRLIAAAMCHKRYRGASQRHAPLPSRACLQKIKSATPACDCATRVEAVGIKNVYSPRNGSLLPRLETIKAEQNGVSRWKSFPFKLLRWQMDLFN